MENKDFCGRMSENMSMSKRAELSKAAGEIDYSDTRLIEETRLHATSIRSK